MRFLNSRFTWFRTALGAWLVWRRVQRALRAQPGGTDTSRRVRAWKCVRWAPRLCLGLLGLRDGCRRGGHHPTPQTGGCTLLKPNFQIGNWPFIFGTRYIMVQSLRQLNLTMVYCAVVNRNWLTNLL